MKEQFLIFKYKKEFDSTMLTEFNSRASDTSEVMFNYYKNIEIQVFENSEVTMYLEGKNIEDFKFVYFKNWVHNQPFATAIANILDIKKIPFSDKSIILPKHGDKLLQMILLSRSELPIIDTLFLTSDLLKLRSFHDICTALSIDSFIAKSTGGREGLDNFLIRNQNEYNQLMQNMLSDQYFIIQPFVPNSFDYRFVVIGNEVKVIKKRIRIDKNTHLNNISLGAQVEYYSSHDLPELSEIAIKAAQVFKRDIAGVDIIVDELTNKPYILEVNPAPAISNDYSIVNDYLDYFSSFNN